MKVDAGADSARLLIRATKRLPEGTIYPALHRLEQSGLLSSRWTTAESGRRRRVYSLTRRGRGALADQRAVWRRFADAIGGLFGETSHARAQHSH